MRKVQAIAVTKTEGMFRTLLSLSVRTHNKTIVNLITPNDGHNLRYTLDQNVIRWILSVAKANDFCIPILYYEFGVTFYDITFIDVTLPEPVRIGYFEEV